MKVNSLLILFVAGLFFISCNARKESGKNKGDQFARILFYNVENLFDTIDTEGVRDLEFTPNGDKAWNTEKYYDKLTNLSKVIASADTGYYPDLIGLCEVENIMVVQDLISTELLKPQGYKILHKDSPDNRGIDVSLVYTSAYQPLETSFLLVDLPGERSHTRDILYSKGILYKDTVHLFVNHWPSRYGGKEESDPKRAFTAQVLRSTIDSIQKADKDPQVIIMGDFNDYPSDYSLSEVLNAKNTLSNNPNELINLAWEADNNDLGSYNYKGDWGTLDQFIVSANLFNKGPLTVNLSSYIIVKKDWMLYTNSKGDKSPSRTYGGKNYYGGYSDHLPILLKLKLE